MEQSTKNILTTVLNQFPQQAQSLNKLFKEDEHFREICEDYTLCLHSMKKIIVTNKIQGRIIKEYKKALKELETELLTYIDSKTN